ncbi:MAG: hypothetical protein GX666_08435 [Tissierellia bacterium]|nr:hypothetical protein [Tissierellia bacterium]
MDKFIILIVSVIAGVSTYAISHTFNKGAVVGSAVVTLLSGLIFPFLFPELGGTLAAVGACVSYAGMVDATKAKNFKEMAAISLITGIIFIIASSAYNGIGGKLGTMGAIGCFAWIGIKKIFIKVK